MAAKNRKQLVYIEVLEGNINFLPKGTYQAYIDKSVIFNGSVVVTARILKTVDTVIETNK